MSGWFKLLRSTADGRRLFCHKLMAASLESSDRSSPASKAGAAGLLIAVAMLVGACGMFDSPREKAAQHLAAGRIEAARIEAINAIQIDAQDHEAQLILAQALIGQGDLVTADRILTKAARSNVDRSRVDRLRLRLLLKVRSYSRLLEEIVPTPVHQGEVLAELLAGRGQAQLATGRREAARASFSEALQSFPGSPEALLGQAQLVYSDGHAAQALAEIEQVIARVPNHAQAWQLKATMLHQQRRFDDAVAAYERAAVADPAYPIPRLAAAELLVQVGRLDDAQRQVDLARQHAPNAILVHHTQATIHLARKEYDKALALAREVLRVQPSFAGAVLIAGSAYLGRGEFNQAEAQLRPRVEAVPDDHAARKLLASTLLRARNAKGALDVLHPTLISQSDDPTWLNLAAEAHLQQKDFSKAAAYYEKIVALRPDSPTALSRLGVAKYAAGDSDQGIAALEKAASLQADGTHAEIPLVMLLLERKEFEQALSAARRLQTRASDSPIGFNLAGVALIGLNKIPEARSSFERAAAVDPNFWPAVSNLARLDLAEQKTDAAKARIEKVLAGKSNSVEALQALVRITGDRGRYIESLEVARRSDPKALAPRVVLTSTYLERGLGERALPIAREIAAIAPGQVAALDLLGSAQLAAGQANEALATFVEMTSRSSDSVEAHLRIAQAAFALRDIRRAESAYRKALEIRPKDTAAITGLAWLYARTGRLADAMKLAEEVKGSARLSARGDTLMGDLLFAAGKFREAGKAFEAGFATEPSGSLVLKRHMAADAAGDRPSDEIIVQWLQQFPTDLAVRAYLGDRRYLDGEYRRAAEIYEEIVKFDPYRSSVHNNLASAYLKLNDPRALAAAKAAFELEPGNGHVLDTFGVAQMRYGNATAAVELLRKAIARLPDAEVEVRVHYALALAKTGEKDAARAELSKLRERGKVIPRDPEISALLDAR